MGEATDIDAKSPTRPAERRQVSVLFTDMVGYTAIVEGLGAEKSLHFTRMIYDRLTSTVRENGGVVRGFAGDSIMAIFGIPEALEDAALRACRAGLAIQASFAAAADDIEAEFGVRPNMRVGVCSGSVVMAAVEDGNAPMTAVGNTVNMASRIQALASSGGCLICNTTRRLVEWLVDLEFDGEHQIKGVTRPQKLWRLLSVREGARRFDASIARGLSGYVGRDDELAVLSGALDGIGDRLGVVDIMAEPGLGKTRLVFEFLHHDKPEDVAVLTGHCSTDGQQVPFLPLIEILRASFRIEDQEEADEVWRKLETGLGRWGLDSRENLGLLLNLLGLKPPDGALDGLDGVLIGLRTRDLLPALLEAQCTATRTILFIDDIHWIDRASEDLLRRIIEGGTHSNLLILYTRRPEYRPPWNDHPAVTTLALKPLAADDIGALAQSRLGIDELPEELIRQVTERAEGNPLFGEEILSFLMEQGALRVDAGKVEFDADVGKSALPESMQNLLSARIGQLEPEDRALLQAAAAIGRRFDPGLLSLVVGREEGTGAALRRMQALDIVFREANSSDYIFKHILLRDSVYHGLVSERRAELHLAIATALEKRNSDRLAETAETLAYHYALTNHTDLAFTYNAMAAKKSLGVFSLDEANRYFATAYALVQRDAGCATHEQFVAFLADYAHCLNISLQVRTMLDLAADVGPILTEIGDSRAHVLFLHHLVACLVCNGRYIDALRIQQELSAMAVRLGDATSLAYALVSELSVSCYIQPKTNEEFESKRREAEAVLASVDDAYLQNYYLANLGWNEVTRGRAAKADEIADRLTRAGIAMNDPRSLGYGTAMKALIAMVSDDHEKALDMAEEALRVSRAEFERAIASAARFSVLVPLGKHGAAEEVRHYVEMCEANGWALFGSSPDMMLGIAQVMDGRIDAGLRHIDRVIARREQEGYQTAADWYRLFLCEVYLEILSGNGEASLSVFLRNFRSLSGVLLFGPKRIHALVERVRANPHFDPDGYNIARCELILGLLYKLKKKNALAVQHLTEARRIVAPSGASPMLTRIEGALAELA